MDERFAVYHCVDYWPWLIPTVFLLGKRERIEKDEALATLEKGLDDLGDFRGVADLKPVEIKIRKLLAMLYQDAGREADALRQYGYVYKHLDQDDEQCRLALERARARGGIAPAN